jgi:hypothetical protein
MDAEEDLNNKNRHTISDGLGTFATGHSFCNDPSRGSYARGVGNSTTSRINNYKKAVVIYGKEKETC